MSLILGLKTNLFAATYPVNSLLHHAGDFKNDVYDGHGQFQAASGDTYFGEFHGGEKR